MVTLENDQLIIQINEHGAEMRSVVDQKSGFQFLWQADEEYWARSAPVLFPIVGLLKDNKYEYKGKTYEMSRHGFARDSVFEVEETTANSAVFSLKSSEDTLKIYPFEFKLLVKYLLHGSNVTVTYEVINVSTSEEMYYSIGGHPAFNVSQTTNQDGELEFDGVYIEFVPHRSYKRIPLSDEGLVQLSKPEQIKGHRRQFKHEDFQVDSLVYEISNQSEIVLQDDRENVEIRIKPSRMNYLGLWSPYPKRGGFICLEPWAGIADSENASGKLKEKDAINFLKANEKMTHDYTISFVKETKMQSIRRWNQGN